MDQDTGKKAADCDLFEGDLAITVLNSLSAHIAILDEDGVIMETNTAWQKYARKNGMPDHYDGINTNYITVCESATGSDANGAAKVAAGIRAVIRGEVAEFLFDYPCHSADGPHWYYMRVIRMTGDGPIRVIASHEEITILKLTEAALRKSQEALLDQKQHLEEANIAMKVLLKQREEDKRALEKKVLSNVKDLILPYVEKLKNPRLKARDRALVEIVDGHLQDIISPLLQRFVNARVLLTPQEMQVAALVKDGKTSKEIAAVLNLSETTINFHRKNLRAKLGLKNRQVNLRSYLLSISQ
jgi:DNA-binding CsgD family transcriptional regulator